MSDTKEINKKEVALEKGVERTSPRRLYSPAVDIVEKEGDIILFADMPGVDENSVDITVEKDLLTIQGTVEPDIREGHRLALSEYGIGDYRRTFTLSNEIDREHIQANIKDGVLRLTLPKAEEAKTRKIAVSATA